MQRTLAAELGECFRSAAFVAAVALGLSVTACDGSATSFATDPAQRNLQVTITSSAPHAEPGEPFELTLVAENLSTQKSIRNVEVLIPLSRAIDTLRWSGDMGRRQQIKDAPLNLSAWTFDELKPRERATHKILVQANTDMPFVAYNAALVFAQGEEGSLLNNGSVSAMNIRPNHMANDDGALAPLRIRSAGPGAPVAPGERFTVRIHIENLSADTVAHDVFFLGCIDANLEMAGGSQNDQDPHAKRFFSWRAPKINPLGQAVIEMVLQAKASVDREKVSSVFTIGFLAGREADSDLNDNWLLLNTALSPP